MIVYYMKEKISVQVMNGDPTSSTHVKHVIYKMELMVDRNTKLYRKDTLVKVKAKHAIC